MLLIGLVSHQAMAQQESGSGGLSEIVVTASRRETNVQDTPIAITAIGGDALTKLGVTDPRQLSGLAPNLNVDQGLGNGQIHIAIRGQASTSFGLEASSPAALYIDDIFQPFQFGTGTQLFDLNRVEVLRGPQGTLFGKNTTAGSLNFYSQAPVFKDEGYFTVDLGGGDFGKYAVEGAFNKAITDDFAIRTSGRVEHRDDYVDNLTDGTKLGHYDNYSGRIQFQWNPGADTKINLKLFGTKNKGDAPIYISNGLSGNPCGSGLEPYYLCDAEGQPGAVSNSSRKTYSPVPTYENYDNYGATLRIEQAFGDYALTSVSNIQKGHYAVATNDDGLPGDFFHSRQDSDVWQMSQEFRLATPATSPFRAIIGLYGQYDQIRSLQSSIASDIDIVSDPFNAFYEYAQLNGGTTRHTTVASFLSATYDVTDKLSVIGGLRYTYERVALRDSVAIDMFGGPGRDITNDYFDFDYALSQYDPSYGDVTEPFDGATSFRKLTWDATVNYKFTDDVLAYAKVGTGFRSGGFFPAPDGAASEYVTLRPETVTSYEAGLKTEMLNHKLRINTAAYLVDYKNMQVQSANQSGSGLGFANAGSARIKGLEVEVEAAPAAGLTITLSGGYNDGTYRKFFTLIDSEMTDLSGSMLPYSAKWTAAAGFNYEVAVSERNSVSLSSNWTYRSRIFFDSTADDLVSDPSRIMGGARIGFGATDRGWEVAAYVNNVLNEDVRGFAFKLPFNVPTVYAPKRTWGIQTNFRF